MYCYQPFTFVIRTNPRETTTPYVLLHCYQPFTYVISTKPRETMTPYVQMEQGTPTRRKSWVRRYSRPVLSTTEMAFMLGKPETGRPMAPEHMRAAPITSILGCGSCDQIWK